MEGIFSNKVHVETVVRNGVEEIQLFRGLFASAKPQEEIQKACNEIRAFGDAASERSMSLFEVIHSQNGNFRRTLLETASRC